MNIKEILLKLFAFQTVLTSSVEARKERDDLFESEGLVILPNDPRMRNAVKQPKYSVDQCETLKEKSPIDVKFYSGDCDELKNDYGSFSDIESETLEQLVESAVS